MFTILLVLTWELRYPQKRGVNRKRGGSFGSCSAREGTNDLPWGNKGLPGDQGQINYNMNFIQDSCQRFSLPFKSIFQWLLQVYCVTQKMHISQGLAFLWITVQYHETKLFCIFHLKLYTLWTKRTHQNTHFQTFNCSHEN